MQTSSLLLRLEALVAARLLTPEQGSVLRLLAWQHDLGLIKAFQVRGGPITICNALCSSTWPLLNTPCVSITR